MVWVVHKAQPLVPSSQSLVSLAGYSREAENRIRAPGWHLAPEIGEDWAGGKKGGAGWISHRQESLVWSMAGAEEDLLRGC